MNAQYREGDWVCAQCGNHNFASRQQCNKCMAPKDEGTEVGPLTMVQPRPSSAAEKSFRPGDWNCLTCGHHNFASRVICNTCGGPRTDGGGPPSVFALVAPPGGKSDVRPGDWNCPTCGNHNFASRTMCNKCGSPRTDGGGPPAGGGAPPSGDPSNFRPGDWNCQGCNNHNFASRQACNKCGTPKEGGGGKGGFGPWGVAVPMAGFGPYQKGGGVILPSSFGAPLGFGGPGGGSNMRPGDWICPSCSNHNYANRTECNKCGIPKAATGSAPTNFRSGDWLCPKCSNHNYASREACNKCGEGKP